MFSQHLVLAYACCNLTSHKGMQMVVCCIVAVVWSTLQWYVYQCTDCCLPIIGHLNQRRPPMSSPVLVHMYCTMEPVCSATVGSGLGSYGNNALHGIICNAATCLSKQPDIECHTSHWCRQVIYTLGFNQSEDNGLSINLCKQWCIAPLKYSQGVLIGSLR